MLVRFHGAAEAATGNLVRSMPYDRLIMLQRGPCVSTGIRYCIAQHYPGCDITMVLTCSLASDVLTCT